MLAATGLAGCVIGAGLSLLVANRYISTAVIRIVPVNGQASADVANQLQRAAAELLSRRKLAELIQRPQLNLYAKERLTTPLEDVLQKVQDHDLKLAFIRPGKRGDVKPGEATAMEVRFEYPDRDKAQALAMAVMRELAQSGPTGTIEYLDYPSLPQSPVFPNRYVISAMGLAVGLLTGAVLLRALRRRTPPAVLA